MTRDARDPVSNPAMGKQWSRDYPIDVPATPTLPDANLRYKEALDWRKWTEGGCSFLLFFRAVLIELSCVTVTARPGTLAVFRR